jgi:hypothetical protein
MVMPLKRWFLLLVLLGALPAMGQVFNCPSFTAGTGGACSMGTGGYNNLSYAFGTGGTLSSGVVDLVPVGSTHGAEAMWYNTAVNDQAFTATFTFVPNGYNLAFVVQNDTLQGGPNGGLSAGAGCEGGYMQFAGGSNIAVNNVIGLDYTSYNPLTNGGSFSYSGVSLRQSYQFPGNPLACSGTGLPEYSTNGISTTPVNLTTGTAGSTTGDTYSVTVTYDGYTLTSKMFDVTAGGSCPGASCNTFTQAGVYIPAIVAGNTAFVGFTSGIGVTTTNPLNILSFSYTVNTPTGSPSYTAYNANSNSGGPAGTTPAFSPVFSVAPGTYAGTQSVAITTSGTPNNYICYTLSATALTPASTTRYPQPDNNGACASGTLYTGAVSISSTATLYAMAGSNNSAFAANATNPTGLGPPSTLVAGTYTIGGGGATGVKLGGKQTLAGKIIIQ